MKRRTLYTMLGWLVLAAFSAFVLLDSFVIARVYTADAGQTQVAAADQEDGSAQAAAGEEEKTSLPADAQAAAEESTLQAETTKQAEEETSAAQQAEETSSAAQQAESTASAPVITDTSYTDDNITIEINEYRYEDTTIYVADVQVASASSLQTAFAQNAYGKNVTAKTSAIAAAQNAILAINGDYYGAREKGYVIRDGVLYRSTGQSGQEDLVIWEDGSFSIIDEGEVSAQELLDAGAVNVFSFGPALIEDGQIAVTRNEEVGKAMASNPRTAIGIIDELHYVFVVSDGRTSESEGLSLYEFAGFLKQLGVETAYNLDGGGSSTMVFNGSVVNNPTTSGRSIKERSVSDIVYIG